MPPLHSIFSTLLQELARCASRAAQPGAHLQRLAPHLSGWSVQQHLEHLAIVNPGVYGFIDQILRQPPGSPAQAPIESILVFLNSGVIPRGRVQAPDFVMPRGVPPEEIRACCNQALALFRGLESRFPLLESSRGTFPHPVLGPLTPVLWLRFTEIHTRHHLAIVDEIDAAAV
jgi:hypothetical protein